MSVPATQRKITREEAVEQCRRNRREAAILESSPGPLKVARSAARPASRRGSFRETPEFGRSLPTRIEPFLDESSEGPLRLIGGGGAATVWYDEHSQSVIKLFAPPCKARFGWVMECDAAKQWSIRPGNLTEAILRFALFEEHFPSGLELDECGPAGEYLTLRQPFIAGHHPDILTLHHWMHERGRQPHPLPGDLPVLQNLTWQRGSILATDVRPENASSRTPTAPSPPLISLLVICRRQIRNNSPPHRARLFYHRPSLRPFQ